MVIILSVKSSFTGRAYSFGHILGLVNGVAINTAHELSHKSGKLEHYLSHLCLAPTGYNHFRIEHPYGHHRRVATPEDPASSQLGESFWQFWPRTVTGSFKSAIEIETRRLGRKGKTFWSLENELFHGWTITAAYHMLMLKLFGAGIIPTQLTQSFCGITLFEVVNYMEHYGLKREDLGNGRYARTRPEHAGTITAGSVTYCSISYSAIRIIMPIRPAAFSPCAITIMFHSYPRVMPVWFSPL